jgi:hypothetical protein
VTANVNTEFWQLKAAAANYYDSHRNATRLSNRLKAILQPAGNLQRPPDLEGLEILEEQVAQAATAKKESAKLLRKLYHHVAPDAIVKFQETTPGLGDLTMAQLVGVVGDFRTYTEAWWEETGSQDMDDSHQVFDGSQHDRDSQVAIDSQEKRVLVTGEVLTCGVRDIWSYCGHGDVTRKRRKGGTQVEQFAAGSPLAKTLIHEMADFALRLNGQPDKNGRPRAMCPYYPKYLQWKQEAAQYHGDWKPLRCHNHAVRKVAKSILKDIWRVQHDFPPAYGEQTPWKAREQPTGT